MESFNELVKQYEPMIGHILRSLHIYKNKEEFFQTGLIALWEAHGRFNPEKGKFSNYAYTFIKGRIMSELTSINKHENNQFYPDKEFWTLIEDPNSPRTLEEEIIYEYCVDLTVNQKKWVLYTIIADLTIKDIAQLEMVSPSTVKGWRSGALRRLRKASNLNRFPL
ncbi:sigma-70 family RNA polymerase sigma factor [Cytobacillus sp. Hz8]|uniref:sigma-70 family RNA polymerase sigma factor n=1 Tax=Cytobacillus sp. Hz8 TaxID=3347168 RepID=UPI0035DF0236